MFNALLKRAARLDLRGTTFQRADAVMEKVPFQDAESLIIGSLNQRKLDYANLAGSNWTGRCQ